MPRHQTRGIEDTIRSGVPADSIHQVPGVLSACLALRSGLAERSRPSPGGGSRPHAPGTSSRAHDLSAVTAMRSRYYGVVLRRHLLYPLERPARANTRPSIAWEGDLRRRNRRQVRPWRSGRTAHLLERGDACRRAAARPSDRIELQRLRRCRQHPKGVSDDHRSSLFSDRRIVRRQPVHERCRELGRNAALAAGPDT